MVASADRNLRELFFKSLVERNLDLITTLQLNMSEKVISNGQSRDTENIMNAMHNKKTKQ